MAAEQVNVAVDGNVEKIDLFDSFKRTPLHARVLEFLEKARELYNDSEALDKITADQDNKWLLGELKDSTKLSVILMGDLAKQRMKG